MKSFDALTERGQARRLRGIVDRALTHYPLEITQISLINNGWNGVFRLDTADGSRYVIRVCRPEFDAAETRSEVMWMLALAQETDISVPEPIKTHDGDVMVIESVPGVPEPRICTVFSWIQGRTVDTPTLEDAYNWGSLAARLHKHAATFTPPERFTRIAYKSVFPFPTDKLVIFDEDWKALISEGARRDVLKQSLNRAERAIQDLFKNKADLRIIHNDLHLWNVMRYRKTYSVIDFEDCMWGYPVQDAGTSLYYVADEDNYRQILAAYRDGYTSHLPWLEKEDGQLDSMIVARMFNMFNLILQYSDPSDYKSHNERTAKMEQRLRHYLDTGHL